MCRTEITWSSPAVGGSRLSLGGQVYGLANAVGTVIVDQWGQDAAVGGAVAAYLAEADVAGLVRVVGDHKDIVLTRLRIGGNHAVLGGLCGVAATDHFVGGQAVGTRCGRVGERTPAAEIDVNARRTIHVDVDAARIQYPHVIPCWVGRGVKTIVIRSRFP